MYHSAGQKRLFRSLVTIVALWAVAGSSRAVAAQIAGATLTGRVTDPSGGGVPAATVTATAPATGLSRSAATATDGSYVIPSLPVGSYDVTVTIQGFKTVQQKQVELNVASTTRLDVALEVASIQETVSVTAETPIVATEVAPGSVVSQRELENLPMNGRQFANLGALAPGTSLGYNADPTKPGQLVIALNGGNGHTTVEGEGSAKIIPISEMERKTILSTITQLNGDKLLAARLL